MRPGKGVPGNEFLLEMRFFADGGGGAGFDGWGASAAEHGRHLPEATGHTVGPVHVSAHVRVGTAYRDNT